jgi:hypothetical protein
VSALGSQINKIDWAGGECDENAFEVSERNKISTHS